MNEVLDKIMNFINENTYILIGICIFLILVLIGYLIDNSIKSKRIRKDIKNKDQVPDNIKKEIIKEAIDENMEENIDESLRIIEENSEEIDKQNIFELEKNPTENVGMELNLDEISGNNTSELLKDGLNEPLSLDLNIGSTDNGIIDTNLQSDLSISFDTPIETNLAINDNNDVQENILINDKIEDNTDEKQEDPDSYILEKQEESEYKNDKKLSDILANIDNVNIVSDIKTDNGIFDTNQPDIVVNPNVKKEEVEIEGASSPSDELDRIMKKLSSTDTTNNEDNYTNIF